MKENYEVCHISGCGYLLDYQIEEKLNQGWKPIGVFVNGADIIMMYFQRNKNENCNQ